MAAGQMISFLDRADFARFDDDGGAPTRLRVASADACPEAPTGDRGLRLSLAPAGGRGSFDGVWWPHGRRLDREAPALVAALSAAGHPISRLSVNGDIWTGIPRRFPQSTRPPVRISWFRTLDPHTVTLDGGNRPRFFLLVIPPDTAADVAADVLRMAAAGGLSGPSGQILRHAGAVPLGARSGAP
ncbi:MULTISPECIES: DUF5994 family protein [unclassified Parafrankia]|uniref:DUF5994 family protein n=1 Tax=unclassified Parafrankia TaxID=2994368 RepID=UPI000DA54738|nr:MULTISPECIES: DUF5994 family protein [unclassified Parafrankia]TCJ31690.1 hypothetical protein E0504_47025 [Parafrankia sp. BMG5.11]CAI7974081.1 conserved hypothetical protein [Frankia sp. Hr75.2]SQD93529.1 conserved hypothetical protein [Parafrankia sp. Ea1.12]